MNDLPTILLFSSPTSQQSEITDAVLSLETFLELLCPLVVIHSVRVDTDTNPPPAVTHHQTAVRVSHNTQINTLSTVTTCQSAKRFT